MKNPYTKARWILAASLMALPGLQLMADSSVPQTITDPVTNLSYSVPQQYYDDIADFEANHNSDGLVFEWWDDIQDMNYNSYSGWMVTGTTPDFKGGNLQIPSTYSNGEKSGNVVCLLDGAFNGKTGIRQVRIPSTVVSIGEGVFKGCTGITHIYFEGDPVNPGTEGLIKSGCNVNNDLGEGESTFHDTALRFVDVNRELGNDGSPSHGYGPFNAVSTLEFAVITNPVTLIEERTFYQATGLKAVMVPSTILNIDDEAFYGCSSLTVIPLPEGITQIGENTFQGCTSFTKFSIPKSVTFIAAGAFKDCSNLEEITFNGNENLYQISNATFQNDVKLKAFPFPANITEVGAYAFQNCPSLCEADNNGMIVPPIVTQIDQQAYMGCSGIKKLVLPRTLQTIGASSFSDCTGMGEIDFYDLANIESASSPRKARANAAPAEPSLTTIGESAFHNVPLVKTLDIPNSVITIENAAFQDCSGITDVHLGKDENSQLATLGTQVFNGATAIQNVHSSNRTPPTGNDNTFDEITYQNAYLHVPTASIHLYKAPDPRPWILFQKRDENTGISDVGEAEKAGYSIYGDILTLDAPADVYDISGRCIAAARKSLQLPAHGIYIIRQGANCCKISY